MKLQETVSQIVRPVMVVLVLSSAVSALAIALGPAPDVVRLDAEALRWVTVGILVAFGIALPLAMMRRDPARNPGRGTPSVFASAMLVHAFSMSSELRLPLQAAASIIAMVCALFLVLATLDGFVERRQGVGV